MTAVGRCPDPAPVRTVAPPPGDPGSVRTAGPHDREVVTTMTWSETHRRWQVLRAVEEELARTGSTVLPWRAEYAELFGDRAGLLAALRYRWQLTVNAQLDTHLAERELEEQRRTLARRARGVLRVLQAEDARRVVA